MINKYYTLILLPNNDDKVKSVKIHYVVAYLLFFVFLIFISGVVFLFNEYIHKARNDYEYARLVKENAIISKQLVSLEGDIENLKKQISLFSNFDDKIRVIVGLDSIPSDIRRVGIGGSDISVEIEGKEYLSNKKDETLIKAHLDVDKLIRQADLQKESFSAILRSISERQDLWDHTPSIRPADGFKTSGFGPRRDPFTGLWRPHEGIDIANRPGTPVIATADGVVKFTGWLGGYGNTIDIDHQYGVCTRYAHLSIIKVKEGERVRRGQIIGKIGSTGQSTGPHLHYEVRINNIATNPEKYIMSDLSIFD